MSIATEVIVTVREVVEADLERLMLHRNEWETRRYLEDCREVTMEDQKRWLAGSGHKYRIIQSEGVDVGLLRFSCYDGKDAEVGCDIFAGFRRKGYGRAAMKLALEMARALGCASCSLWVFLANQTALQIYAELGFMIDMRTPVKWFFRGEQIPVPYFRMVKAPA